MSHWTKVVVFPLGLAGFALFILFLFSQKVLLPSWLVPTAILLALAGGIVLAFLDRFKRSRTGPQRADRIDEKLGQTSSQIQQATHGDQSPAIAGVQHGVHIEYGTSDQSGDKKG